MNGAGRLPSRIRRCRWSWPICGALLLAVSALVWTIIGQLLTWWLR
ncbi:hypothetical protein [Muricoccus nepalensis]|nr:hypothetical protein [Roseomonas nepalensis]